MLNASAKVSQQIIESSLNRPYDNSDSLEDQLTQTQVEELINNLANSDLFKESFTTLLHFFSNYPYTFSTTYLQILFEFLNPELDVNDDFRAAIFELLNALFVCTENNEILEIMGNETFYALLWPYIDHFSSAMQLEKWLIKTYDSAFEFAMQNSICQKLLMLLSSDNPKTAYYLSFISSFSRYTSYSSEFSVLLNKVCDLTFSETSEDIFSSGILCLCEFSRKSINAYLQVLTHVKFQEFCGHLIEHTFDSFSYIVSFLDTIFHNPKCMYRYETMHHGIINVLELYSLRNHGNNSDLLESFLCIVNAGIILLEKYINKECDDEHLHSALHAFSMLLFNSNMVRVCLERNVHRLLFTIAFNAEISYFLHSEVFHSICTLISTSDLSDIPLFLELGFIQLVENQIALLLKIPNAAIDALEAIVQYSSKVEGMKDIKDLIFDNEVIVSQLRYIAEHPEEITEEDGFRDCSQHAEDFLAINARISD